MLVTRGNTARCPGILKRFALSSRHVTAPKHGGSSTEDNLALPGFYCKTYKNRTSQVLIPKTEKLRGCFIRGTSRRNIFARRYTSEAAHARPLALRPFTYFE